MRIGDVNKDNYKQYLQMLGVKNAKDIEESISSVLGGDNANTENWTHEDREKHLVSLGYIEEGMLIDARTDDGSWRKIVPVSDDVKDKLIATVRRQFMTNGNGIDEVRDGDEIGAIIRDYCKTVSPSERLSVAWTLGQIANQEAQRMVYYVKSQMPSWKAGDPIDRDVLARAVSGDHFDGKA